ncbi:MAG: hypothetical protein K0R59_2899 [Sphingobacterium sp.]|jgi:hypothetical protein|uniref:hypothetical protein n=1 Tax=unclassified Sphingobacterium TaxID=2609468 RepID=UPI0009858EB7|nr:hypothetical protein [Sphingobacterium sp. CZ-UAM]MDF2517603.1 hypothetical protein [Sphingobacterium sp.]OOG16202.1 hypothetical protein BWD42_20890 [Sphingobacterium sp. CZ-UAM]
MDKIDFIPLIELPTIKDLQSNIVPVGTAFTNTKEWDLYQENELRKNYIDIPPPITTGIYQYRLFDIKIEDLRTIIKLHIGDMPIKDACSLFGGYAICINGQVELYPQCCGLLEEIQQWKKLLNENFEDFFLLECHPSPLITKNQQRITIFCYDKYEPFFPYFAKNKIELDYQTTKNAFITLLSQLHAFSEKLDTLAVEFKLNHIANILIWGRNEKE